MSKATIRVEFKVTPEEKAALDAHCADIREYASQFIRELLAENIPGYPSFIYRNGVAPKARKEYIQADTH